MANYEVDDIRNLVFIGHGSCGKTSLADAILFKAKVTTRQGSVDDGSSIFDSEPDEIARKLTIDSSISHIHWKDSNEINIIDTPGYPDFISQVTGSLSGADIALIGISATNGIELNTRKMWKMAGNAGLCRAIVITKMDEEKIDLNKILTSITDTFGKQCIPVNLPKGIGADFNGTASVITIEEGDNVEGDIKALNEKLVEAAISVDDDLTEKYLSGEEIDENSLDKCLNQAILNGSVVPIFFCSAKKGIGVTELLDIVVKEFPSPASIPKAGFKVEGTGEEIDIETDKEAPFSAQVFKSIIDPFVGKLSFLKIYSGQIDGDFSFINSRTGKKDKFSHMFLVTGKEHKEHKDVKYAVAGDIVAVSKIENIEISDTLCTEKRKGSFPEIEFITPMVSLALTPKTKGSEHKIGEALRKLSHEDRTFKVSHDTDTNELVITGISKMHLDVILDRMKNRFSIDVDTKAPKIPYRETITGKAESKYKHKKQSGGHGQYGEVCIRIEPLDRGKGFLFKNSIVGGSIPGQYIPAVEKGIKEAMVKGVVSGHPLVDFQVDLYDGSFHNVDSSEAAFKIAGAKALQDAFNKAKPVLLEPVVNVEVVIPGDFMGEISGNLSSRRGHIQEVDAIENLQIVKASVPMAEVTNYESELMSITGGQGTYSMEFSHYDVLPSHIAADVIASETKQEKE